MKLIGVTPNDDLAQTSSSSPSSSPTLVRRFVQAERVVAINHAPARPTSCLSSAARTNLDLSVRNSTRARAGPKSLIQSRASLLGPPKQESAMRAQFGTGNPSMSSVGPLQAWNFIIILSGLLREVAFSCSCSKGVVWWLLRWPSLSLESRPSEQTLARHFPLITQVWPAEAEAEAGAEAGAKRASSVAASPTTTPPLAGLSARPLPDPISAPPTSFEGTERPDKRVRVCSFQGAFERVFHARPSFS